MRNELAALKKNRWLLFADDEVELFSNGLYAAFDDGAVEPGNKFANGLIEELAIEQERRRV